MILPSREQDCAMRRMARAAGMALVLSTSLLRAQSQPPQTPKPHVLILIDQGQLSQAIGPRVGQTVDRLVEAVGPLATSDVVVVSGEQSAKTDVARESLSGDLGFFEDIQQTYGISLSEALDVQHGNESVRETLVHRRCTGQQAAADCGAVVPASKALIEDYQRFGEQSLRTIARVIHTECQGGPGPSIVAFVTPGAAYPRPPSKELRDVASSLRQCGAAFRVLLVEEHTTGSTLGKIRAGALKALAKAANASVRPLPLDPDATLDSLAATIVDLRPGQKSTTATATTTTTTGHAPRRAPAPDTAELVAKASAYVASFARAATVLVAEEHYVQERKARSGSTQVPAEGAFGVTVERRVLDSEVALVQIVDQQLWMLGRDIVSVDNRKLQNAERVPLTAYHPASMAEALEHFRTLATQGARFNIGNITRNLSVPTLALWFLSDAVRNRFTFMHDGDERIDGRACAVIKYREESKPYLLSADGRAVPVRGRFWIEQESGAILRTELLLFDDTTNGALGRVNSEAGRALVSVRYMYASHVGAWVPLEMTERYDYPNLMDAGFILGKADYGNYKKFSTDSRILR